MKEFSIIQRYQLEIYTINLPWCGGFYKSLICIVKSTLRKVLGKSRLNYEELSTIITEVEGIINTRPLTYLHDDDDIKGSLQRMIF